MLGATIREGGRGVCPALCRGLQGHGQRQNRYRRSPGRGRQRARAPGFFGERLGVLYGRSGLEPCVAHATKRGVPRAWMASIALATHGAGRVGGRLAAGAAVDISAMARESAGGASAALSV